MASIPRKIAMLVVSTAALGGLTVLAAPVASAAPAPAAVTAARPHCKPAHTGREWRWDDGRRGGHWDRVIKNRRGHVVDVKHVWRDNRFCAPQRRHGGDRDWDR
jgi:hypothetical protein